MQILVIRNGLQEGPFSVEQVRAGLQAGTLSPSDMAWHEGRAAWTAIDKLLTSLGAPPPPTPPSPPPALLPAGVAPVLPFAAGQVSHALPWVSAFVPLAGLVLDAVLNEMGWSNWVGTVAVIGTNILLLTKDEKQLKAQGFSTEKMGSAWLVPVYLFKRVQVAGGGYGYAVCWMITFFISLLASL